MDIKDHLEYPLIEVVYNGDVVKRMTMQECIDSVFELLFALEQTDPLGADIVYDYINEKLGEGIEEV